MQGRFVKLDISQYKHLITYSAGVICNNQQKDIVYRILLDEFGKPNANSLRKNESTWKYVLKYQDVFLTVYDYNDYWSLGFLEIKTIVPDYPVIKAIANMFFSYITKKVEEYKNINLIKT